MSPLYELERTLFGRGPVSRRMSWFFPDIMDAPGVLSAPAASGWVRMNVWDAGAHFEIQAEVPGLTDKDVTITFERGVLTIAAEQTASVPEGYVAQRRERPALRFSRSVRFGRPIDADNIAAVVRNGVLTVTLPKRAKEAPRSIPVTSGSN